MISQVLEASALLFFLISIQSTLSFHDSVINVAWFVSEKYYHDVSRASSVGALSLAVRKASNLTGNTFNITWADSGCNKKDSVIALYRVLIEQRFSPDLILGPQCSNAMQFVGQLASFRNLPAFGWVSESYHLRPDSYTYDTLVRVYPPMNSLGLGLVMMLDWLGWKWVTVVSSDSSLYSESPYFELGEVVMKALTDSSRFTVVRYVSQVKSPPDDNTIRDIYTTVKKEARIVIFCVPFGEIISWMRVAYDMNMHKGDYIFILVNAVLPSPALYKNMTEPGFWRKGVPSDANIEAAMTNLMILTMRPPDYNLTVQFLEEASKAENSIPWLRNFQKTTEPSDFYAPYLHDAFLLFAKLSGEANASGCGLNNGTCILQRARNRKFEEPELITGKIILNSMGDRIPEFVVLDLNRHPQFHAVLNISVDIVNASIVNDIYAVEEIMWGDGKVGLANKPLDIPLCGFEDEKCPNLALYIGLPVGILVLIGLVAIGVKVIRRYQFEQSIHNMAWKIDRKELIMTDGPYGGKNLSASRLSLRGRHRGSLTSIKNSPHTTAKEADCISVMTSENDQIFISTAKYRNTTVAVKSFVKPRLTFDRKLMVEMTTMTVLKHNNLATFIGAASEPPELFEVWEYCSKGSLQDVIWNDTFNLDNMFKFSIVIDVLTGVKYLHDSHLKMHGRLKSSNVVVDGRWVCKLTDYGLFNFREGQQLPNLEATEQKIYSQQLWTAPELLRESNEGRKSSTSSVLAKGAKKQQATPMSQEGDIYACAIIIKEVMTRTGPYTEYEYFTPKEIVERVKEDGTNHAPFRPKLPEFADPDLTKVVAVMKSGWNEKPTERPSAQQMLKDLQRINPFKSANVMDNMIRMMERYSNNLEEIVSERMQQVEEEKKKSENLLFRMLPRSVAEKLKCGESVEAESFDAVTIYFSDIVKFTNLSSESTPLQIVTLLNSLYTLFDGTCSLHDVYKVETIGDAYMFVSGLPVRNGNRHAAEIANCALEILSDVLNFKVAHKPGYKLQLRIGLHTGPVVSGIVGLTMPRYCLFGSTVSHASLMESGGMPMRIHLSEMMYQLLSKFPGYHLALRGSVTEMKGIGIIKSYWLYGRDGFKGPLPDFDSLATEDNPKPTILPVTMSSDKELHTSTERDTVSANDTLHDDHKNQKTRENQVKPIAEVLPNVAKPNLKDQIAKPTAEVLPNQLKQDLKDTASKNSVTSPQLPLEPIKTLESSLQPTSLTPGSDVARSAQKSPTSFTVDSKKSSRGAKPGSAWMETEVTDKEIDSHEHSAVAAMPSAAIQQKLSVNNESDDNSQMLRKESSAVGQVPQSFNSNNEFREVKSERRIDKGTTEIKFNLKDLGLSLPKTSDTDALSTTEFMLNVGDFDKSAKQNALQQNTNINPTSKTQLNKSTASIETKKQSKGNRHPNKLRDKSKTVQRSFHPQNRVGVEEHVNVAFTTDSEDETSDNKQRIPSQGRQLAHRNATLKTAWTVDSSNSENLSDNNPENVLPIGKKLR